VCTGIDKVAVLWYYELTGRHVLPGRRVKMYLYLVKTGSVYELKQLLDRLVTLETFNNEIQAKLRAKELVNSGVFKDVIFVWVSDTYIDTEDEDY
jgi:hypothetical protein